MNDYFWSLVQSLTGELETRISRRRMKTLESWINIRLLLTRSVHPQRVIECRSNVIVNVYYVTSTHISAFSSLGLGHEPQLVSLLDLYSLLENDAAWSRQPLPGPSSTFSKRCRQAIRSNRKRSSLWICTSKSYWTTSSKGNGNVPYFLVQNFLF